MHKILTKNFSIADMHDLFVARAHDAYASRAKLFAMKPADVIAEVVKSGLRGRGGAGFPTGKKWSFIPQGGVGSVQLVVNADESEPGTFKDRALIERDPHLLIEGILISAYAIGARNVHVFFRGEYAKPHAIFMRALTEARDGGLLELKGSELHIDTVQSGGAYICGEETALINAIEGRRGVPRIRPPYPAVSGLFALPTIVNNVETLSNLPFIIREGADAYATIGTEKSTGTKLISASGHINNPGVYEVDMGTPLAAFLAVECGGTTLERALKAVIPGGPSVPVLTAREALGAKLDYESMQAAGSQLGSGGFIVCDETARMPRVLADITRFFAHESCGQCTPCREGSGWLNKVCTRVARGEGREGDVELLHSVAASLPGRTICTFADALAAAVMSFVTKFKKEFEDEIRNGY